MANADETLQIMSQKIKAHFGYHYAGSLSLECISAYTKHLKWRQEVHSVVCDVFKYQQLEAEEQNPSRKADLKRSIDAKRKWIALCKYRADICLRDCERLMVIPPTVTKDEATDTRKAC